MNSSRIERETDIEVAFYIHRILLFIFFLISLRQLDNVFDYWELNFSRSSLEMTLQIIEDLNYFDNPIEVMNAFKLQSASMLETLNSIDENTLNEVIGINATSIISSFRSIERDLDDFLYNYIFKVVSEEDFNLFRNSIIEIKEQFEYIENLSTNLNKELIANFIKSVVLFAIMLAGSNSFLKISIVSRQNKLPMAVKSSVKNSSDKEF